MGNGSNPSRNVRCGVVAQSGLEQEFAMLPHEATHAPRCSLGSDIKSLGILPVIILSKYYQHLLSPALRRNPLPVRGASSNSLRLL
jgi:hypothetical protein